MSVCSQCFSVSHPKHSPMLKRDEFFNQPFNNLFKQIFHSLSVPICACLFFFSVLRVRLECDVTNCFAHIFISSASLLRSVNGFFRYRKNSEFTLRDSSTFIIYQQNCKLFFVPLNFHHAANSGDKKNYKCLKNAWKQMKCLIESFYKRKKTNKMLNRSGLVIWKRRLVRFFCAVSYIPSFYRLQNK